MENALLREYAFLFYAKMEYVHGDVVFRRVYQLLVINLIKTTLFYSQLIFRMIQ